jgi:hypothetical protein
LYVVAGLSNASDWAETLAEMLTVSAPESVKMTTAVDGFGTVAEFQLDAVFQSVLVAPVQVWPRAGATAAAPGPLAGRGGADAVDSWDGSPGHEALDGR